MTPATFRLNLLGRAELQRRRRRRQLLVQATASVAVGLVVAAGALAWQHDALSQQRERNAAHARELVRLEAVAQEAAALRKTLEAGSQRQRALQGLQAAAPVQGLVELAHGLPAGVRFKQVQQDGDALLVAGSVASGERLAALMAAWSAPERAWQRLELVKVAASTANTASTASASGMSSVKADEPHSVGKVEGKASHAGELDFSIRLRRPPTAVAP